MEHPLTMKHNPPIYLASKAVEFFRDSVDNMRYLSMGNPVVSATRARMVEQE
jgi:hypothetical protein